MTERRSSGTGNIGVLIIDDFPAVRAGLRALIETEPDMHVVGVMGDANLALEEIHALCPDVVVVDPVLRSGDGMAIIRSLRQIQPQMGILVLSNAADEAQVLHALQAGAHGYCLKDGLLQDVIQAVRDIYHGKATFHAAVAPAVLRTIRDAPSREN